MTSWNKQTRQMRQQESLQVWLAIWSEKVCGGVAQALRIEVDKKRLLQKRLLKMGILTDSLLFAQNGFPHGGVCMRVCVCTIPEPIDANTLVMWELINTNCIGLSAQKKSVWALTEFEHKIKTRLFKTSLQDRLL